VNERLEGGLPISLACTSRRELTLIAGELGPINPMQEGTFMTRKELHANQEDMWRALFGEQRMALTLAVEMLSRCHLSPQQILAKTMRALEGSQQDS